MPFLGCHLGVADGLLGHADEIGIIFDGLLKEGLDGRSEDMLLHHRHAAGLDLFFVNCAVGVAEPVEDFMEVDGRTHVISLESLEVLQPALCARRSDGRETVVGSFICSPVHMKNQLWCRGW